MQKVNTIFIRGKLDNGVFYGLDPDRYPLFDFVIVITPDGIKISGDTPVFTDDKPYWDVLHWAHWLYQKYRETGTWVEQDQLDPRPC